MQDEDNDLVAWNFRNLLAASPGQKSTGTTIEWRQPPGISTAEECLVWTELVVAFVQAARAWPDIGEEIQSYPAEVQGLQKFVLERGQCPGSNVEYLNPVFEGKSGKVTVRTSEPVFYWEEVDADEEGDDLGRIDPALLNRLRGI
jgi:hypothetical protein